MNKSDTIERLYEDSNHGTQRRDVEAAYNAGLEAAQAIAETAAKVLRGEGAGHEAAAVESVAIDIRGEL